MSVLRALLGGALMICVGRPCVALQLDRELQQQRMAAPDPPPTADDPSSSSSSSSSVADPSGPEAPCFVDDVLAALRDSIADDGAPLLLDLARRTSREQPLGLELLRPVGATEELETGALHLTFDLPEPPLLRQSAPVLLLALEPPPGGEHLDVTFSSPSLQPDTQSACISEETRYVLLTGWRGPHRSWRIGAATSPLMKPTLRTVLTSIGAAPLLLLSGGGGGGADSRAAAGSEPAPSHTAAFLCELRRFLGESTPQGGPRSPPLPLASLQSPPAVAIGPSSSEALLEALINSSTLTVFSFAGCCSWPARGRGGELSLSPPLLEELRQRLAGAVARSLEEVGGPAARRLRRLVELSATLQREPPTGSSQYCGFLLLKALQTVGRGYEAKRGLRAARASSDGPGRGGQCGLRSLTVSLERLVISPASATINNCAGSCRLPLANTSSHVILLNLHLTHEGQGAAERPPCCVPVAYEDVNMVHLDADGMGTELITHKDVVATECQCR